MASPGRAAPGNQQQETKPIRLLYIEVADGAGRFKGHYDLLLEGPGGEALTVQVPQDGRCFWHSLCAEHHGHKAYVVQRKANGVPTDVDRFLEEVLGAHGVMRPYLERLEATGRGHLTAGFRSGATLVEEHMIQEICDVLEISVAVVLPSGFEQVYRQTSCSRCRAFLFQGSCLNPHCTREIVAGEAEGALVQAPDSPPAAHVEPRRLRLRAKTRPGGALLAASDLPTLPLPAAQRVAQKQVKTCSRCLKLGLPASGHRRDGKCPMKGQVPGGEEALPRWVKKKKTRKLHPGKFLRSVRRTVVKRVLARATSKKVWVPQAWDPPYTRAKSPRRQAKKRIDLRRATDPHKVLDDDEDAAREALRKEGFLWQWPGSACLSCQVGRYGSATDQKEMYRCSGRRTEQEKPCRTRVSMWHGCPWQGSTFSPRRCYNLAIGYAAGLTPTMASLDKGVCRNAAGKLWGYLRHAEAFAGRSLQESLIFSGTAEEPVEVEIDEAVVKKVPTYDHYLGERTGTEHHAVFAMRQRGSLRTVAYLMEPRWVPVRKNTESGSALPPPSVAELRPWIEKHVGDWVVLHADGARAYPLLVEEIVSQSPGRHIFVDQVCHSEHQWTKFHRHPVDDHPTVSRIRVTAGTQLVESWWDTLKHHAIPEECPADQDIIQQHLDALVYRQWCIGDPLSDLGAAVKKYMSEWLYTEKVWPHQSRGAKQQQNAEQQDNAEQQEDAEEED